MKSCQLVVHAERGGAITGSSAVGTRSIPQDVVDCVMEFFYDDKNALKKCSLVCRTWLWRASIHLFQRFSWPPCRHAWRDRYGLQTQCLCLSLGGPAFWSSLFALFERSPRLQDAVGTLQICCSWSVVSVQGDPRHFIQEVTLSDLSKILDKVPQLRCLYLDSLRLLPDPSSSVDHPVSKKLQKLTLRSPQPAPTYKFDLIEDLVRHFDQISLLQFVSVYIAPADYNLRADIPHARPHVKAIEINNTTPTSFPLYLTLLSNTVDLASVSSLILRQLHGAGPTPEVCAFLQSATKLHALQLDGPASTAMLAPALPAAIPKVRTLTVYCRIVVDSWPIFSTWDALRRVARCQIPTVDEVAIHLTLETNLPCNTAEHVLDEVLAKAIMSLDWRSLDQVLAAYGAVTLETELGGSSSRLPSRQAMHYRSVIEEAVNKQVSAEMRRRPRLHVHW